MTLTKRNYYSRKANTEYMSVSQFKSFEKCEACAMAEIKGDYKRKDTTALLVGSYVDSFYEGTLRKYCKDHPQIFKKDGTLKSDFLQAEEIIARTQDDRLFQEYMSGRKQVLMEGVIAGVKVKIKIDSLLPDRIVDMKIIKDMGNIRTENGYVPFFEAWGYDLQGAVYQEIVRQNLGVSLPFFLAVATKEEITDLGIIKLEQPMLDACLDHFAENVQSYDAIKKGIISPNRCEKCDWCKESKVLTEPISSDEFYLLYA